VSKRAVTFNELQVAVYFLIPRTTKENNPDQRESQSMNIIKIGKKENCPLRDLFHRLANLNGAKIILTQQQHNLCS
jgi:hypothetical protein